MKILMTALRLSALLALLVPAWAGAQSTALVQPPTGGDAFTLRINAPDDVRQVLERHLDVLRYRQQPDLSDGEMARLLLGAEQDARELLATMGYF